MRDLTHGLLTCSLFPSTVLLLNEAFSQWAALRVRVCVSEVIRQQIYVYRVHLPRLVTLPPPPVTASVLDRRNESCIDKFQPVSKFIFNSAKKPFAKLEGMSAFRAGIICLGAVKWLQASQSHSVAF